MGGSVRHRLRLGLPREANICAFARRKFYRTVLGALTHPRRFLYLCLPSDDISITF